MPISLWDDELSLGAGVLALISLFTRYFARLLLLLGLFLLATPSQAQTLLGVFTKATISPANIQPGQTATIAVTAINPNGVTLYDVESSVPLPYGSTGIQFSNFSTTCNGNRVPITYQIDLIFLLDNFQTCTYQFNVTAPNPGTFDFQVSRADACAVGCGSISFLPGQNAIDLQLIVGTPVVVSTVTPPSGPLAGGTLVTITGSGFTGATRVMFGGNDSSFVVNSDSSITARTPSDYDIISSGINPVDVKVVTAVGTNASGNYLFSYTDGTPPSLSSVSPTAGGLGQTEMDVELTGVGTHFLSGIPILTFGSGITVDPTSLAVISDTDAKAQIAIPSNAPLGATYVRVQTGSEVVTLDTGFTVLALPVPPTVTSISPATGSTAGGTHVTINGANFDTVSTSVKFGAVAATTISYTSDQLIAVAPPGVAGTVDITVRTLGQTSAPSGADQYTYVATPTVTGISPTSGPATGGTSVVIMGTNFTGATAVTFGAASATSITVNSATSITATSPAGSGTVDARVTTIGGTSATSLGDQFTYVAAPAITSANATTFTVGASGVFTITSTGNPTAALTITGALPSGVTFVDNGNGTATLSGTAAANSGGVYPITIATNNGVAPNATQSFTLTVNQTSVITSANATSFTVGTAGSFTVTSTSTPIATLSETGALPAGVTFVNNGNGTATLSGTPTAAGDFPLTIAAANGVLPNASQSFTLTVSQAAQTIAFTPPATQTYVPNGTVALSATGGASGNAVTFASTSTGVCTTGGTNGATVTFVTAGQCNITASQLGNANYLAAADVAKSFTISQAAQTIVFTSTPPAVVAAGGSTYTVAATGGASGNAVTFSIDATSGAGVCSIPPLGSTVTFLKSGSCVIDANQAGNGSYAPAPQVQQTIIVQNGVGPTVTAIGSFIADRNNAIVSNLWSMDGTIDRLNDAPGGGGPGTGLTDQPAGQPQTTLRSGLLANQNSSQSGTVIPALTSPASGAGMQDFLGLQQMVYGALRQLGETQGVNQLNYSGPFSAQMSTSGDMTGTFHTSLSQIMKWNDQAQQKQAASMGLNTSSSASAHQFNPLDVWMQGTYAAINSTQQSKFGLLSSGVDYVFNRNLLLGFYGQVDFMNQTTGLQAGGTGWMVGPYGTMRLSDQVFLEARGGYGRSSNSMTDALDPTLTDQFGSTRWLASAALAGRWQFGDHITFKPNFGFTYFTDSTDAYVNGLSVSVPSVTSQLGQFKFSPEVAKGFSLGDANWYEASIAPELIYNFTLTTADGLGSLDPTATGPQGLRGAIKWGVSMKTPTGLTIATQGSYDGIGSSGYSAITASARLNVPLN
jgi:IPT/TIG domain